MRGREGERVGGREGGREGLTKDNSTNKPHVEITIYPLRWFNYEWTKSNNYLIMFTF